MRSLQAACTSLLVFVLVACGGSTPPVQGAAPPGGEADEGSGPAPTSEAASGSPASEDEKSGGGPASEDDNNAILQLVVDDPELDSHLQLGEPGRFPLKVAGDQLPSGLKVVKATEPVKIAEPPKSKKEAVLVFTGIEVQGDKATVRYRYDIEGIRGTVTLARTAHGWELKSSRVVEH